MRPECTQLPVVMTAFQPTAAKLECAQERRPATLSEFLAAGKSIDPMEAQRAGHVAVEPVVIQICQAEQSMAVSAQIAGLRAAITSPAVSHIAAATAALLGPCQDAVTPSRCGQQLQKAPVQAAAQPFTLTCEAELAIICFGDECKAFRCPKRRGPGIGKLIVEGLSLARSADTSTMTAQDMLLLDLRSQRPEYSAILNRRAPSEHQGPIIAISTQESTSPGVFWMACSLRQRVVSDRRL